VGDDFMAKSEIDKNKIRRVYKDEVSGDFQDMLVVNSIVINFFWIHFVLELCYIGFKNNPMVIINIFSMLTYAVANYFVRKGNVLVAAWICLWEVYVHAVCATVFMGGECGFYQWLFGLFCAIFVPFVSPILQEKERRGSQIYAVLLVLTYIALVVLTWKDVFPKHFHPSEIAQRVIYCINSIIGFFSVMVYTCMYTSRVGRRNEALLKRAEYDQMTGFYNRQRTQRILENEIKAQAERKLPLSVAIMDVDFFKHVNDTYGHLAGDFVLKELSKILKPAIDQGMIVGRWGGEEFILINPEEYPYPSFCMSIGGICRSIEEYDFVFRGQTIPVTVSIGSASYTEGMSLERLLQEADKKLYKAKEGGRNRVVC
jgi:diguanylate cyclase (GGDEF)-like protein